MSTEAFELPGDGWMLPADAESEWTGFDGDELLIEEDRLASGLVTLDGELAAWAVSARRQEELLCEWEHANAQIARWEGERARLLAAALDLATEPDPSRLDPEMTVRSMAAELGCAVGVSDRSVENQMSDAVLLRDRFPATFACLRAGELSRAHIRAIVEEGSRIADDSARADYEHVALERAQSLTPGRLRAAAKAIAQEFDPEPPAQRYARAFEGRCIGVRDEADGMSRLTLTAPSPLIHGIFDRATQMARTIQQDAADLADAADAASPDMLVDATPAVDDRTLDQLRADVVADLLLTGHPTAATADAHGGDGLGALRGIVQITIPAATLTGTGDEPAYLAGSCPVDPVTARALAGAATTWERVFTDPVTGRVVDVDRRFPTEAQRRLLRARDEHCRFPGCRQAVWRCDVDHTVEHQHGGKTTTCNMAHLCRRHHTMKHATAWQVKQQPGGVLEWTSPTGRAYIDRPPPTVRFVAART